MDGMYEGEGKKKINGSMGITKNILHVDDAQLVSPEAATFSFDLRPHLLTSFAKILEWGAATF